MADVPEIAPDELLLAIETGSKKVHELATGLSNRIQSFERWINTIPGRVETTLFLDALDGDGEWSFLIRLHRSGKRWIVSHGHWSPIFMDGEDPEWQPVTEASIETKMAVVRALPKLLEKLAETQRDMAKQIEAAQAEFDGFAQKFGIQGEGS